MTVNDLWTGEAASFIVRGEATLKPKAWPPALHIEATVAKHAAQRPMPQVDTIELGENEWCCTVTPVEAGANSHMIFPNLC